MEKTLIIIKPDAVQRGIVGDITTRFEKKGLKLVGCKMITLEDALLRDHYSHIADKPFFAGLADFMKSSPVVVQAWEGKEAVTVVRTLAGATNAREADVGTIRGDLAMSIQSNVVHASDGEEAAKEEVARFFAESELFNYDKSEYLHLYAADERK